MNTTLDNIIDLASKPSELAMLSALVNLLAVMTPDSEGNRFIRKEHAWVIDEAKQLVKQRTNT